MNALRKILPTLFATLTGVPRYIPDVEWSSHCWTHNVFRVYELIFGRREGIKAEMSMRRDQNGKVLYACHSWESVFLLMEQYVRSMLSLRFPIPVRIYVPILQTPQGIPIFASPYLFSIAFDASLGTVSINSSASFSTSGSNRMLVSEALVQPSGSSLTSIKYANVDLTQIEIVVNDGASDEDLFLYILPAPATGSNTLAVVSNATTYAFTLTSYTGVTQSTTVDAHGHVKSNGSVATITLTTVAPNCWMIAGFRTNRSFSSTGPGTTDRMTTIGGTDLCDSNAALSPGSHSLTMNLSAANYAIVGISLAPYIASDLVSNPFRSLLGVGK